MQDRDPDRLEAAILAAEEDGMDGQLDMPLETAKEFLAQQRRLEELRDPIHQLSVAEIKSFDKPPPIVHTVIVAMLMMLGDEEKRMKVKNTLIFVTFGAVKVGLLFVLWKEQGYRKIMVLPKNTQTENTFLKIKLNKHV